MFVSGTNCRRSPDKSRAVERSMGRSVARFSSSDDAARKAKDS
jgi:hypothetical protein